MIKSVKAARVLARTSELETVAVGSARGAARVPGAGRVYWRAGLIVIPVQVSPTPSRHVGRESEFRRR